MELFLKVYLWTNGVCCAINLLGLVFMDAMTVKRGSRAVSLVVSLGFMAWAGYLLVKA
jgi:hypothetical protein